MAKKKKSVSYKTLYKKTLDEIIELLYSIEYDHDNRIEAVWRQDIELAVKKYKRKRNQIK